MKKTAGERGYGSFVIAVQFSGGGYTAVISAVTQAPGEMTAAGINTDGVRAPAGRTGSCAARKRKRRAGTDPDQMTLF